MPVVALVFVEGQKGGSTLSHHQVTRLLNGELALVLDVRDKKEFDAGHIAGALNIPFAKLDSRVTELEKWKEKPAYGQTSIMVGKSRRIMWMQAQEEINLIKKNICELQLPIDIASDISSPIYKVYQTLFGSSSFLFNCF